MAKTTEKTEAVSVPKAKTVKELNIQRRKDFQDSMLSDTRGQKTLLDPEATKLKFCMTESEAKKFLGGADPNDYFRGGLVDRGIKIALNGLLDDQEIQDVIDEIVTLDGILCFKPARNQNYIFLIPKKYATQLSAEGDYIDPVDYVTMMVSFNGGGEGVPKSYEETYMRKYLTAMVAQLQKNVK